MVTLPFEKHMYELKSKIDELKEFSNRAKYGFRKRNKTDGS